MIKIGQQELEWLTLGCAVFGAGGGGDPLMGSLMAGQAIRTHGEASLIELDELDDDDVIVPAAMVGAPTVMVEKFCSGDEGERLQESIEFQLGRRVAAYCLAELGGINGVLPFMWAARCGLPVVNCDLMGRAFPELQMTSAALAGIPISPCVVTDERGNLVSFTTIDANWAETLVRNVVSSLGGEASVSLYAMTVAQAREATVPRTVTRAMEVGRLLLEATDDPVGALCDEVDGYRLIEGKIVDVDRQTTEGFAKGSTTIEGVGADAGRVLRMEFQNENAVVLEGGDALATVPDIITAVDVHTARPIVTEQLRYGQRISLIALPCDPIWRTDKALAVVGPRAFSYELDYVPLEQLHA